MVTRISSEMVFSDTEPSNPSLGLLWWDTINNALNVWNGSTWKTSGSGVSWGNMNADLLPDTTDTRSLGSVDKELKNLYLGTAGKLYFGLDQSVNLYYGGANQLKTDDQLSVASITSSGVVHGGGSSGQAFKIGDDFYLVDINVANTLGLQGAQASTAAILVFGSGGDTNLYRSDANILKTDDNFDALSLKIGGTEVISSSRVLSNLTGPTSIITSGRFTAARMLDGTSGYPLLGAGTGSDPAYGQMGSGGLSFGVWEKIGEVDVGSDTTYVEWTSLSITTPEFFIILANIKNAYAGGTYFQLFVNGDTTTTNYYVQTIYANSTTLTGERQNRSEIAYLDSQNSSCLVMIPVTRDPDGYPRWTTINSRHGGSSIGWRNTAGVKTGTVTDITSLRIACAQSDGIATGSKFLLFKVKAT